MILIMFFRVKTPCGQVCWSSTSSLKMDVLHISETMDCSNQSTRRLNPKNIFRIISAVKTLNLTQCDMNYSCAHALM